MKIGYEEVECKLIYVFDTFIDFYQFMFESKLLEYVKCLSPLINLIIDFLSPQKLEI